MNFIKTSIDDSELMDECIDEDGFCNIHSLLNHYKIPVIQQEKRELILLKQGDILIFWSVYLTMVVLLTLWTICVCIYMHQSRMHL